MLKYHELYDDNNIYEQWLSDLALFYILKIKNKFINTGMYLHIIPNVYYHKS